MTTVEQYKGLWRASANEAVPYTQDFPEALLILPEILDGAIGQGNATKVITSFVWNPNGTVTAEVSDNGQGIKNERRLLTWAASKSADNIHRNGHGLKKAFTKFMPNYDEADWEVRYRRKGKNIQSISGPFLGFDETRKSEDEDDETSLMPSGTSFKFTFKEGVLGKFTTQSLLLDALKELVCTRYSEAYLSQTEFVFNVTKKTTKTVSSREAVWHSFQWHVEDATASGVIEKRMSHREETSGGFWTYDEYYIKPHGGSSFLLKDLFPTYGRKNQDAQRIHIALEGRMIEALPRHRIFDKKVSHNDENGTLGFVNFVATDRDAIDTVLPIPATTKVSFYENNPVFKEFMKTLYARICEEEARKKSEEVRKAKEAAETRKKLEEEAARKKADAKPKLKRRLLAVNSEEKPKPSNDVIVQQTEKEEKKAQEEKVEHIQKVQEIHEESVSSILPTLSTPVSAPPSLPSSPLLPPSPPPSPSLSPSLPTEKTFWGTIQEVVGHSGLPMESLMPFLQTYYTEFGEAKTKCIAAAITSAHNV